jgi:hypothetical protein
MGRLYTISVAVLAATGSFLFGYDSGVMTDVIDSPNFLEYFNTTQTSSIVGAINSTFSGGGALPSYSIDTSSWFSAKEKINELTLPHQR